MSSHPNQFPVSACRNPYDRNMSRLLAVQSLTVELRTAVGTLKPVNEVSLRITPGESLGIVGESGSGKTMLSMALMGLLPPGAKVTGEMLFHSSNDSRRNLRELNETAWRSVRGREIAMIFQEPMTSLNPVLRIGAQIEEAILAHESAIPKDVLHGRVMAALQQAAVPEP